MKTLKQLALASTLALSFFAATPAMAATITFDEFGSYNAIQNGYNNLNWNNFFALNAPSDAPNSGYFNGLVSGSNVAYNSYAQAASFSSANAFSFVSAFFTGAWNDGLNIHVVGSNGSQTFTKDFTVNTNAPSQVFFNWSNLTSVSFSSFGGTPNTSLAGNGTHFAIDNINVAPVPEPETYALMGMGLVGLLAARRRKAKQA